MATHSSILAWRIPWTEEPGGLQSMGSQRVRHNWATWLSLSLTVIWTYYQPSSKADPTIDIFFRDKMPFPQRIELTQPPSVVGWQRARPASGHWGLDGRWGPGVTKLPRGKTQSQGLKELDALSSAFRQLPEASSPHIPTLPLLSSSSLCPVVSTPGSQSSNFGDSWRNHYQRHHLRQNE